MNKITRQEDMFVQNLMENIKYLHEVLSEESKLKDNFSHDVQIQRKVIQNKKEELTKDVKKLDSGLS